MNHELTHRTFVGRGIASSCSCGWTPGHLFQTFEGMFATFKKHEEDIMMNQDSVKLPANWNNAREQAGAGGTYSTGIPVGRDKMEQRRYEVAVNLMGALVAGTFEPDGEEAESHLRVCAERAVRGSAILLEELGKEVPR